MSVTVAREDVPPATLAGLSVREVRTAGETLIVACCVEPSHEAEMMAESLALTGLVVTLTCALVAPVGMVTLAGTFATDGLLLKSVTTAPPAGAGPLKLTDACEELPPITFGGLSVTKESAVLVVEHELK